MEESATGRDQRLAGLTTKISDALSMRPEVLIIHPAELEVLASITDGQLKKLAAERGWRVIRRLGGRQIEFYNDAGVKRQAPLP